MPGRLAEMTCLVGNLVTLRSNLDRWYKTLSHVIREAATPRFYNRGPPINTRINKKPCNVNKGRYGYLLFSSLLSLIFQTRKVKNWTEKGDRTSRISGENTLNCQHSIGVREKNTLYNERFITIKMSDGKKFKYILLTISFLQESLYWTDEWDTYFCTISKNLIKIHSKICYFNT